MSKTMNVCLILTLLTLVSASEDFNTSEIKKRMKLISGVPNYGAQNIISKFNGKSDEDDVKYSECELEMNYHASAHFNPKGMGHLYKVTRYFLDVIQPNSSYPDSLIIVHENGLSIGDVKEEWPSWLQHYAGIASVVCIGVAFAVLMPLIGLFFCCCRCGGKCGGQPKREKRHDSCKRTTLVILLSGVAVIILFSVVCAFVTNEHMKDGIKDLTDNISINLEDTNLYLDNTKKEVDHLLIQNFKELRDYLDKALKDAGEIVKDQLAVVSRAVALTNLTNIVTGMEVVKQDLAGIQIATKKLQQLALTLGDYLDVTRGELLQELHNCRDIPACRELLNHRHIAELRVVENFNELPDVANTFATISRLLGDHDSIDSVQKKVLEGQRNFNNIKYEISEIVNDVTPYVDNTLDTIGKKLNNIASEIKRVLHEVRDILQNLKQKYIDQGGDYINNYAEYRYYLGLGVSGALLLIFLCLTFGLLCGICGKRPEEVYHDDGDCCTTLSGSRFLILAVILIFLFSTVLMIITLVHFLVGVATDNVLCTPLKNPSNNKLFGLVDKFANLNLLHDGTESDLKISEVIMSFHYNKTIYQALKLKNIEDIEKIQNSTDYYLQKQQINQFKNRIKVRKDKLELLTPDAKAKLRNLAESPLNDIHFDKYAQLLNVQITNINLTQLSYELLTNAEKIPDHASSGFDLSKVKKLLRTKARFLELLQRDSVAQIRNEIQTLKANVTTLKEHLKFNHTSLRDALENLLEEVESAQLYLSKNGTTELNLLLDSFFKKINEKVDNYIKRVVTKTKEDIGRSWPLSNAYNATLVASCNRIMDPFNGFWVSVGWSILLFIPVIILSVKLSTLYSKSEAYGPPGMYAESEYLYDAYADRENMSLAMAQVEKKKKKGQENHESGGNGTYLQDYSAHLGRSDRPSASNEARYNDMAPKHWGEFSNPHGSSSDPPRYHHPPSTEYERPPPYYYPGPDRTLNYCD